MLPPRWVRRVVLAPLAITLTVLLVGFTPVWLLVAFALSPVFPGRWRPLRFAWLITLHLILESALLLTMFGLWVVSGFGWAVRKPVFEAAHYELVGWYLRVMFAEARRVLNIRVEVTGPSPEAYTGRPLIVFCRHAGPGDSFLLAHALVNWYGREPRIVLKDTMQWDPAIDVVLNRLPNRFISTSRVKKGITEEIAVLADNLDANDAFVIFPEGGNFTENRRARAIRKLRDGGLIAEADKAEQMRHVLPPRPGGVLAALANAAEADIVWVAHTGTDEMFTMADVWREMPMDTEIEMRWWHVPQPAVPTTREERLAWLYAWWARIDAWVGEQRGDEAFRAAADERAT